MSITTYAFDVYGTLINTDGVLTQLRSTVGEKAAAINATWRSKQLEYSFRRGLMLQYAPFPQVTAEALDYALALHDIQLTDLARENILAAYRTLPAFPDAVTALRRLGESRQKIYAFSNGPQSVVTALLRQAGLLLYFAGVVSVEATQTFKPSPRVYQHFARSAQTAIEQCALVSGNTFDVLGAQAAGMQGIWVRRDPDAVFDPWERGADRVVDSLEAL
jgi:2-haloacid dehalogenase